MDKDTYMDFLQSKRLNVMPSGFGVKMSDLPPQMKDWQALITRWALRRGKVLVAADCGLGKTLMQLAWAQQVCVQTGGNVIIAAPLAVAKQTQREGEKFGIPVTLCRRPSDLKDGINVTNYDLLEHFSEEEFAGIVGDEGSILKGSGPLRTMLTEFASGIPFRMSCSATPAPNDIQELVNQAEWLGIMRRDEITSLFFTQDGNSTQKKRLKRHARKAFWEWVATWTVMVRKPSDLGIQFSDAGYVLPEIVFEQHVVGTDRPSDRLFQAEAHGIQEQRKVRRDTLEDRCKLAVELMKDVDGPRLYWCDLNPEANLIQKLIPGCVQVAGRDKREDKEQRLQDFAEGRIRNLVTKPDIAGHGMNLQVCADMVFVGLGNSWEKYYQAYKRCHRFGQERLVTCRVVTSDADGAVVANIQKKHKLDVEMTNELRGKTDLFFEAAQAREEMDYTENEARGRTWECKLGDSILRTPEIPTESVGHILFSPPFPTMYAYTNSPHDLGNTKTFEEMLEHFRFLMRDLKRILLRGRKLAMHLTQGLAFKSKDGHVGRKDFRGRCISMMEEEGWYYHSEICIDKDPQVKAVRTKDRGLLFKTLAEDAALMAPCLADYLLVFAKPGDNPVKIRAGQSEKYRNPKGWITEDEWIEWAAPVWYRARPEYPGGIRETDVLNVSQARTTDDERHLCPLQRGVVERAVKLWSNPLSLEYCNGYSQDLWKAGATVFTPFLGIGTEVCGAIELGRYGVGIELKPSYYQSAIINCRRAESANTQLVMALEEE